MVKDYKTPADYEYERYVLLKGYRPENDIPDADLLPHDTQVIQGISEEENSSTANDEGFQNVPNADDIIENTPVDPAAPNPDIMHGIDLLNGYNGKDTE